MHSRANTLLIAISAIVLNIIFVSALDPTVPLANDLGGIHLLLENDVDTNTPKYPVIFLPKARTFIDSQAVCVSLNEDIVLSNYGNLSVLLNNTSIAHNDIQNSPLIWVRNADKNSTGCFGLNTTSGYPQQLPCDTLIPSLCTNTMPRYTVINSNTTSQIQVNTTSFGVWKGYRDQNQFRFLGIPYAEPPIDRLRFQAPVPANASKYIGDDIVNFALDYGNACIQSLYNDGPTTPELQAALLGGAIQSEDCLYLNIYTPSLGANVTEGLPVMVYIHGGGFAAFAGSTPIYEPGNLVSRAGVVVVSINYRLAVFGLLRTMAFNGSNADTPGNLPTRDQILALKWVQDHISNFGGDPRRVTVFGESAGGYSIRALLSAPSAFNLYHNVIIQSDILGLPFSSLNYTTDLSKLTMEKLGCNSTDLICAQNKTIDEIRSAELSALSIFTNQKERYWVPFSIAYRPTVDGDLIPDDFVNLIKSGTYNSAVDILLGFVNYEFGSFATSYYPDPVTPTELDENRTYSLRDDTTYSLFKSPTSPYYLFNGVDSNDDDTDLVREQLSVALTDYYFGCPLFNISTQLTRNTTIYAYRIHHGRGEKSVFGVDSTTICKNQTCHGDDNIPTFGSADAINGNVQTGDDARFSRQVIDRWSTFAKTGNPNPTAGTLGSASKNPDVINVQWPLYNQSMSLFEIKLDNSTVTLNPKANKCQWIENNIQYQYQINPPVLRSPVTSNITKAFKSQIQVSFF